MQHPDAWQVLVALDQLGNAILGGWADETMSSRAYRHAEIEKDKRWPMVLIDHLFFWQDQHCKQAYESELERSQLPPEMRKPQKS